MQRAFYSLISTAYMLLAVQPACCQNMLNGVVTDSVSGQPLAFVSVGILGSNMGTLSDIDGKFGITGRKDNVLLFSYVGYMPAQVTVTDVGKLLHIKLKQQTTHLQEVTVTGGVNPAWRIIKAAQARREANNPENLSSFSYRTHNKFYITAQAADPAALSADTQTMKLNAMLKRQHLFLNESVTERKYKYPRYNNEKVIAAKTSGFKEVSMVALAGQFQPFCFYNNFIEMLNKKYLNPLAINSLRKYDFTLEETLIQFPDTVFVISFIPLYGKNFDGLKGTLYISSKGYAVQNVIASPADTGYISFKMQQKYAFIDNKAWFPVQINTDLVFNKLNPKMPFMGVGRTYLTNIIIGESYRKRDFIEDELEIPIEALSRPDSFWTKYLTENDSSTAKERRTYLALDSLMEKVQAPSKILNGIDYFTIGKLPWGKTDIDLNRIVQSNQYEAVRLGTGLHTSDRLTKYVSAGGYAGWGFQDRAAKYGADVVLKLYPKRELHIKAAYSSDISEPGNSRFAGYPVLIDPSAFRHFLTYRMDKTLTQSLALSFRPARFIHTEFGLAHYTKTPQYGYAYAENTGGTGKPLALRTAFEYTEAEISFRYSHNEKFTLLRGYRVLTENGYPMLYISYAHGFNGLLNGNYTYNRFNIRLQHQLVSSFLGTSSVQLDAGFIDAALPYPLLFNGRGTKFGGLPLLVPNYFQTMDLYAFTTDRFVSLLLSHNFGNLLFNGKNFKPEWVIVHNLLFGSLKNPSAHTGIETLAPTKGYFEAGLLLNNLLRFNYLNVARIGFGGGLFYRYGTYSKLNFTDNLSPVLSVVLRF